MKKPILAVLSLAAAVVTLFPVASQAQSRVRAGTLSCTVAPGVGLIIGSRKTVDCVYSGRGGYRERYTGAVGRIGLDVGFTTGGRLAWAVFAPSRYGRGALAGTYIGAGAEATLGAGAQANVLVGGSDRSIALQPLSIGVQTGADLALAVSSLQLEPAGMPMRGRRHHRG